MRRSLLALTLVGSLLAVAGRTVMADNPAGDSIPNVGDMDVPADGMAVSKADTNAAVLAEGAPPPAAAEGIGTAKAAGPSSPNGNPAGANIPVVESISVPANDAAADNPPAFVPPPAAAEGLARAEEAAPTSLADNPAADSIPDGGSISVPAADEAEDNPPAAVPTDQAASGLFVAEAAGPR
jgi:hypothetical protein